MNKIVSKQSPFYVPTDSNKLLEQLLSNINASVEVKTYWDVINVNAIQRLKWSDHGPVHFQIVANSALRMLRILKEQNVKTSIETDFSLSYDHAELVVFLGSVLHDIGMTIDRLGHEEYSLIIANSLLPDLLNFLPDRERIIVTSEALHTIISHRSDGHPRTIEAGIVRIADALDMTKGRARVPYQAGVIGIHAISVEAIDKVEIGKGKEKPIKIFITMNNSAGIFQVDELLKEKIDGSGIEKYIEVKAVIKSETEKKLIDEINLFSEDLTNIPQ